MEREEVAGLASNLLDVLSPNYSDEEQVTAKEVQKGYGALQRRMNERGRLVVTVHGHPDAIVLPYKTAKNLSKLLDALIDRNDDEQLLRLAAVRLAATPRGVPVDEALAALRTVFVDPHSEEPHSDA